MDLEALQAAVEETLRQRAWSLNRLGRETGIQPSVISRWLNAQPGAAASRPSPKNLEKLAPVLGLPVEDLMRLCGYLPGPPRAQIDARRQAIRDQLDHWLTAVGPEYEEYFWQHLKDQGDSAVDLIRRVGVAVNPTSDTAVNAPVGERRKRGRDRRNGGSGPIRQSSRGSAHLLVDRRAMADRRQAA